MNLHHLVSIFNIGIRAYVYLNAEGVFIFLILARNSSWIGISNPAAQSAVTDGCWVVFCTSKIMGGGFWTPQFRRTLRGQERVASLAGCESSAPRWARPQCNPYLQKLVPSELDKKEGKLCIWSRAVAFSGGIFMRFLGPKAIMAGWNSRVSQSYIDGRFSIGIIRLLRFCLLEEIDQT